MDGKERGYEVWDERAEKRGGARHAFRELGKGIKISVKTIDRTFVAHLG
jgi:hypothetical protein